ncbi:MAG: type III pantothenate kinase [Akkermansia sp.]|nr:type III pantothenate kinase [Akkermansia sp.]
MKKLDTCLLIDNSNSRTKFALSTADGIGAPRILPTEELAAPAIRTLLADWCFGRVYACSVVPAAREIISDALAEYPVRWLTHDSVSLVDFSAYPGVSTLGADRIANALAAVAHAPLPLVAVDMGTATTFEVVVQGGGAPIFVGGIITPGFKSFAACLPANTAMLPAVESGAPSHFIGRSTREAMSAGVVAGYAGLLDSLLDGIENELGESVSVVFTGGDASLFAPLMRHRGKCVASLTLQGLARWACSL